MKKKLLRCEFPNLPLSPLRYPGSKRRTIPYLKKIIELNKIKPNVLVEPFVGGGSVFLYLLKYGIVQKAIIADKDPCVYAFWKTIFSDPDYLISYVNSLKVDLNTFYSYKEVLQNYQNYDLKKRAEACLFLNRTSFSGLLTINVGPLGGKEQNSPYKIACRFTKSTIISRIRSISPLARKVIVLNSEWKKTIEYAKNWIKFKKRLNELLIYLDPPFYVKADDLYREYFNEQNHKALCEFLANLRDQWILSYDNNPNIIKLYSDAGLTGAHIKVPYSINSHAWRIEKELVISPLRLPALDQF